MLSKAWSGITYPFPIFNGYTVEIWEWISNFTPHFILMSLLLHAWTKVNPCKRVPRRPLTLTLHVMLPQSTSLYLLKYSAALIRPSNWMLLTSLPTFLGNIVASLCHIKPWNGRYNSSSLSVVFGAYVAVQSVCDICTSGNDYEITITEEICLPV